MTARRPLQDRLDELVAADPDDFTMLGIAGLDDGIALRRVYCRRHQQHLNWTSTIEHLRRTEASHRFQMNDQAARLHQRGDLIPADPDVPHPWDVTGCGRCHEQIVWANTAAGGRLPVDARPDPAGSVVLTTSPGADRPLAMFLTATSREHVDDESVYRRHTCRQLTGSTRRRRRTTRREGGR